MSSIRRFLVVVLLATITLINFLAALHGYRTSMAEADLLFDSHLADIASVLAVMADGPAPDVVAPDRTTDIVFQVWQGGRLESASGNAPTELIASLAAGYADENFAGYRWRVYRLYVPAGDRWLIVAERSDVRYTLAENIILESVLPIILGLPLAGVLIWMIVTRGLSPLRELASEMSNKRSDDLSVIADYEPPQELAALISSINDLLRRLSSAFDREKRFAADAAHELRTPISVLKVQLHNLLRDAQGDKAPLVTLEAAVERMGRSVEQVLMLYRTAPEQFAARFIELDLVGLTRQVIAELYPQLEARNQQIELVADKMSMRGDSFALQTLLTNLIGNASKYSGDGGEIRVILDRDAAGVRLTVEDSGPGIPVDQHGRVFERFFRVGVYRHDGEVAGSGIGLAIVQHVADIHGARISLGQSGFVSGLAVTVTFPDVLADGRGTVTS